MLCISSEWFELKPDQMQYLVQVRPPGDTMTDVLRELVKDHNITNAAVIFDDSYGCIHKCKATIFKLHNETYFFSYELQESQSPDEHSSAPFDQ